MNGFADQLKLISNEAGKAIDLMGAIDAPPSVALTIDGASTLEVVVADHKRELLNHPTMGTRSWANAAGVHWELVGIRKSGDHITLTFEDGIVAALRRRKSPLTAKANTTSRRGFAIRLAKEARVKYAIDPTHPERVHSVLQRSADGKKSSSWDVLGADVAEPIKWRRFSDGEQLVMGGDAWLMSGYKKPIAVRENTGGFGSIDFDLDVAKRASTATATVDVRELTLKPGTPVKLDDLGPGDGLWLVSEVRQSLTSPRASVGLVREQHVLKEPKPKKSNRRGHGKDSGDPDYVPGGTATTTTGATGTASNPARERMVQFALAQSGKPYEWGASGPSSYDCSGLVQVATTHAGKTLGKPVAAQWPTCQRAGKAIPVSQALKIRGALLFRLGGAYNHVAISLGDGRTVEAKGRAYGCGVFGNAAGGGWSGAALWL